MFQKNLLIYNGVLILDKKRISEQLITKIFAMNSVSDSFEFT